MKNIFFAVLFLILISGCATAPRHLISPINPLGRPAEPSAAYQAGPAGDAYKYVLFENEGPYFVKFNPGEKAVLGPGGEITFKRVRPLGGLGSSFGRFTFMAYAYREYNPQTGRLSWFVGQKKVRIRIDGKIRLYNGRPFGDRIKFGEGGWRYPSCGFPDKWKGSFFGGIVSWEARFKHK